MRRSDVMSQRTLLRELVLRNGGRMLKNAIRNSRGFRGWKWPDIYVLIYSLREEFFGKDGPVDGPYGIECWQIYGDEVVALENKLTIRERNKLIDTRHRRQSGSGERTIPQNEFFRARIKKEMKNGRAKREALEESNRSLGLIIKSSSQVVATTLNEEQELGDNEATP
ncbi:unnamed protein product [marine sediment metagenome]|uniref:Uncharacterized protein n=1 Tax=marine sediment metagenome TaxID=412755 RepID=X1SLE1_9ZZZZ